MNDYIFNIHVYICDYTVLYCATIEVDLENISI